MTELEYYEYVRAIGLRRASVGVDVFFTVNGEPIWVQPAKDLTPEARAENLQKLRELLQG